MENFRPNVASILRRPKTGRILVCQRRDHSECWQFPQGGVDPGEDLISALKREVEEEVGVSPAQFEMVACRTGYRYVFPNGHMKRGEFHGQEQTYFLCDHLGRKRDIVVDGKEFVSHKWIAPAEFEIAWIPEFKKPVFRDVFRDFFGITL